MAAKVVIHGADGRMGQRLVALAEASDALELLAGVDREVMDQPAEAVLPDGAQVVIDFSQPAGTRHIAAACKARGAALVVGTTGLTDADHAMLDDLATHVPVLQAPNMSLGVNLMFALVAEVAQRLGDDYDIEVVETHHRFKKDAPSGTALGIASSICNATGKSIEKDVMHGRYGDDETRRPGEIGMHALRSGDVIGRHTASFGTLGEELAITHTATDRDVFVHGALRAAAWLAEQKPGRYGMKDVLGL